ncbi:MAG: hypothetical protein C4560_12170 [Nitrospiraceae bacterium]|nr:MAG: hypothetical protein C4560_12170 [Nitrospiraceae bacterium]
MAAIKNIDLKREQEATLDRPPRAYGMMAKILFRGMDIFYGKELTLGKVRVLEILARIPYQTWEISRYHKLSHRFSDPSFVGNSTDLITWSREAQDNEFWHLQVVNEKIREDNVKLNWYKDRVLPVVAVFGYNLFCRFLAFVNIREEIRLNADLEDHAEHEYMMFVKKHPSLDRQPVPHTVSENGGFKTWGDVFRKIGLDERAHMNNSLSRCGRESEVVQPSGY